FDRDRLSRLGVSVDSHGKMPDVILFLEDRNQLVLVESVTSHGPVDAKRHHELSRLFGKSSAGLIFVTAFPDRSLMGRYLTDIAWESEVWVANAPSHLIHFNGDRFLGPHP
ncbi:MAG TPA: BsuBI/PstI family type II restriction endonuclease, partial [Myxococcota bacterium]|nr:BsuBI/PstI family type II restriction endonuclease [Myxococcota bacterium]